MFKILYHINYKDLYLIEILHDLNRQKEIPRDRVGERRKYQKFFLMALNENIHLSRKITFLNDRIIKDASLKNQEKIY